MLLGLENVGSGSVLPIESVGTTLPVSVSVLMSVKLVGVGMSLSLNESVGSVRVAAVSEGTDDEAIREGSIVPMLLHSWTYSVRKVETYENVDRACASWDVRSKTLCPVGWSPPSAITQSTQVVRTVT